MQGDDLFDPSGLTALVFDDKAFERRISIELLRGMGFGRVHGAGGPAEAWALLLRAKPDIVLVEWSEIPAAGLDFVRRVRASEDAPDRAVSMFMLTARGGEGDVETARRAGVDGYLRKPITALALQKRVRRVLISPQPFTVSEGYVGPCRRRRRPDLNFIGPWRRLDDVAPQLGVSGDEEELDLKAQLARARVAALEACARDLAPGDADAARRVYKAAQDLIEIAEQIGDAALSLGAKEMTRYLQAQGATENLRADVVQTHVAALHQIAHLPHALDSERQNVAQSLKRMVDKKLRSAAA